ncbi:MAG: D-alanine--D-alanine ligase [Anaerolineales bacterium]|nr:D-alanine--D-alanine ligase [Anaerolineales bacterium]
MRICILSDEKIEDFNPTQFMEGYDWEFVTMKKPIMGTLRALEARNEFDVYINLCEGYEKSDMGEEGYEAIEVVQALEALNLPFTGADSTFFDPTREQMQAAADAHGVGFAKGYRVNSKDEAKRLVESLRYPIMVKHPQSYGSTGMIKESRCDSLEEVLVQVERVCKEYGAARMEEFIVGREFNVLIVDNPDDFSKPIAYPPTELVFPPGEEFWHTVVKWDTSLPFNFARVTDPELISRLQDIGVRMYKAIGAVSYGRCDVRMNERGEMFILEINPNPAIMLRPDEFGPADFMILYDEGGYKVFFDRMFRVAKLRQQMRAAR